jgi:ATP-dependent DNA helicase RecQ
MSDEFPDKKFILRIYEALGNYFQIAVGFGAFKTHDFSLPDFCSVFKFPAAQTHNALKILESAGYIEYVEDPDNSSRLLFRVNRDELYKMDLDKLSDDIIQVILRSYTGLFADYVFIDESLIAARVHSTKEAVYNSLITLSRTHIIHYIPRRKLPQIIFTQNREETRHVAIPRSVYEDRRKRTENRIVRVIEYITEHRSCRTRMLLRYFGEKTDSDCRICDVCLGKNRSGLKNWEFNKVREALLLRLEKNTSESIYTLAKELPLEKEKNIQVIRFLSDNDERITLQDSIISMIK